MNDTTGKVWLITGASSGFGRAIAQAALDAGDTVVLTARRAERLADLAEAYPDRVHAITLDVTDHARVSEAVAEAVLWHGRIDVLVNNAGRGIVGAVEETSEDELRDLMDLHFHAPMALVRAVLPHMRRNGSGAIVQMSSMGGRMSFPGVGAYSATKFALEGASAALAQEVAPFGIKVLIVEPGAFRTEFAGGALAFTSARIGAYDELVGPVREGLSGSDGNQPGDPAKAAAAILTALGAAETPLRLPLGNDAVDAITAADDRTRADLLAWEKTSRDVEFDR